MEPGSIYIYIRTSPFKENQPFYSNGLSIPLPTASDDTRLLVNASLWGLKQIFKPNYNYAKAGIMLSELVDAEGIQTDLFSQVQISLKSSKLMGVLDGINKKMGKESIKLAREGFKRPWKMKQGNKSPCYTTKWNDLIKV